MTSAKTKPQRRATPSKAWPQKASGKVPPKPRDPKELAKWVARYQQGARRDGRTRKGTAGRMKMVTVTLRLRHTVNGMPYGPGTVTVPQYLADYFEESEQRVMKTEINTIRSRAFIITRSRTGVGYTRREVPPGRLDYLLGQDQNTIPV